MKQLIFTISDVVTLVDVIYRLVCTRYRVTRIVSEGTDSADSMKPCTTS